MIFSPNCYSNPQRPFPKTPSVSLAPRRGEGQGEGWRLIPTLVFAKTPRTFPLSSEEQRQRLWQVSTVVSLTLHSGFPFLQISNSEISNKRRDADKVEKRKEKIIAAWTQSPPRPSAFSASLRFSGSRALCTTPHPLHLRPLHPKPCQIFPQPVRVIRDLPLLPRCRKQSPPGLG